MKRKPAKKKSRIEEKILGATGSISGTASILGSWQVCHSICLGIISLLSIIGITLTGMPLEFLTRITVPMWIIAFILYAAILIMYFTRHCISRALIFINGGLIIAGIPFKVILPYQTTLWVIGGSFVLAGVIDFIKTYIEKKGRCCSNG